MKERVKVGWATKWLSNRKYLNEVSVEGKISSVYFKHLGHFDSYQNEVIRSGNCITLLSSPFSIKIESFWKLHFLEENLRFVFFTFNKSFVLDLIHHIPQLKPFELAGAIQLFQEYFEAFSITLPLENDEELQWCMVKNEHLKNDPHFEKMYLLDKVNRQTLLTALLSYAHPTPPVASDNLDKTQPEHSVLFIDMLNTQEGLTEIDILNRIKEYLQKAGFEYDIFQNIGKGEGGRNLYGLNPRIEAVFNKRKRR